MAEEVFRRGLAAPLMKAKTDERQRVKLPLIPAPIASPSFDLSGARLLELEMDATNLMDDDATGFEHEPKGLEPVWRQLSEIRTSSPKVWMDAYLAAFAINGSLRLVTFDKDFKKFEAQGLDLLLLS